MLFCYFKSYQSETTLSAFGGLVVPALQIKVPLTPKLIFCLSKARMRINVFVKKFFDSVEKQKF